MYRTIPILLSLALYFIAFNANAYTPQQIVDDLATNLEVKIEVLKNTSVLSAPDTLKLCQEGENMFDGGAEWNSCSTIRINLTYRGGLPASAFTGGGWNIYMPNIRRVVSQYQTNNPQFDYEHINGDYNRLKPNTSFSGFVNGQTQSIDLLSEFWWLFSTDFMPRYYVADDTNAGVQAKVIASTDHEESHFYAKAVTANHHNNWKRSADDSNAYATSETRYSRHFYTYESSIAELDDAIIPTPDHSTTFYARASLTSGISFNLNNTLSAETQTLVQQQFERLGVRVNTTGGLNINATVNPSRFHVRGLGQRYQRSGAYLMYIIGEMNKVDIIAYDNTGVFYALQSLISLLPPVPAPDSIPGLYVQDTPRFDYRGMQLDVARHFHNKNTVFMLLDQMAAVKLNKLHLHLTDDEGWRLQIPGLPELTEIGGKRCHDLSERTCLQPALGSGPDSTTSGSGYFTRQDYIDIIRRAKALHIEVLPEIDMPAHARAAVVAMKERARRTGSNFYRLDDPNNYDNDYTSIQLFHDSYINPCQDSTFNFVEKVMTELQLMHQEAGQPLRVYNVGADEAKNIKLGGGFQNVSFSRHPVYNPWKGIIYQGHQNVPGENSQACIALIAQDPSVHGAHDLNRYFVKRVSQIANSLNIPAIAGWSDGMNEFNTADDLDTPEAYAYNWTKVVGNTALNTSNQMLAKNFKVILTPPDFVYFDHPYEVDTTERGYYWATRFTDTKKVFSFAPENLPQNAETSKDRDGKPWKGKVSPEFPKPHGRSVLGMEGQIWSETIRTREQLEYMAFPRMIALAERAWHRDDWELYYIEDRVYDGELVPNNEPRNTIPGVFVDGEALNASWNRFANVLGYKVMYKLTKTGVSKPRVPKPGAFFDFYNYPYSLYMKKTFPMTDLQYRNGSGSWQTVIGCTASECWLGLNDATHIRTHIRNTTLYSKEVDLQ